MNLLIGAIPNIERTILRAGCVMGFGNHSWYVLLYLRQSELWLSSPSKPCPIPSFHWPPTEGPLIPLFLLGQIFLDDLGGVFVEGIAAAGAADIVGGAVVGDRDGSQAE